MKYLVIIYGNEDLWQSFPRTLRHRLSPTSTPQPAPYPVG